LTAREQEQWADFHKSAPGEHAHDARFYYIQWVWRHRGMAYMSMTRPAIGKRAFGISFQLTENGNLKVR
jgi:hypothetical protein